MLRKPQRNFSSKRLSYRSHANPSLRVMYNEGSDRCVGARTDIEEYGTACCLRKWELGPASASVFGESSGLQDSMYAWPPSGLHASRLVDPMEVRAARL